MSKRLVKMDMVVEKLRTFQESCGLMVQRHYCNPHDPRMGGKCLSVCVFVCIQPDIASIAFFWGCVRTSYCKGNRANGSNRSMWGPYVAHRIGMYFVKAPQKTKRLSQIPYPEKKGYILSIVVVDNERESV